MASSGAAEKEKFHEGTLEAYQHEELGPANDVSQYQSLRCNGSADVATFVLEYSKS
jgi:hypothetical protein